MGSFECESDERKLLVADDILWVVKPLEVGKTFLRGSRHIEIEDLVIGLVRQRRELLDLLLVLEVVSVNSRLRTNRPFARGGACDFLLVLTLSIESMLIICI